MFKIPNSIISIYIIIFEIIFLCLYCSAIDAAQRDSYISIPMRGNALDLHFSNFTASEMKVAPSFYSNDSDTPDVSLRNVIFIPNTGDRKQPEELPLTFTLPPAKLYKDKNYILKGQSLVQGLIIYNNIASYTANKLYNNGYNRNEGYTTYSSFMWSQGVRAPDDGSNVFKNAMDEIDNLKYSLSMNINKDLNISLDLCFKTKSNLITENKSPDIPPELNRLRNINVIAGEIAAFTKIAGGILHMATNPPAGILVTISGVFNEVQALSLYMINTYVGENIVSQSVKSDSWLSTPFNIQVKPENFYITDSEGNVLDIADCHRHNGELLFYLGNNIKPQYIKVEITPSLKGDLFVNFVSSSLLRGENTTKAFINNSEFKAETITNTKNQK